MRHEFPNDETASDPSWFAPLEQLAALIADDPRRRFFRAEDFMLMIRLVRPPRPSISIYKHVHTRRSLNLDTALQAYRYVSGGIGSGAVGRHLRQPLDHAIDALGLYELPWLKAGLELERRGLSWEQRFSLRCALEAGELDDFGGLPRRLGGPVPMSGGFDGDSDAGSAPADTTGGDRHGRLHVV